MRFLRILVALGLAGNAAVGWAQQTPIRPSGWTKDGKSALATAGPGLLRIEGRDEWSGVRYVRVLLAAAPANGEPEPPDTPSTATGLDRPTLTGQCTQDAQGKLHFELFANFGGVTDGAFYPPWHSQGPDDTFPPRTSKVTLTMEFLGYTKVKPFKRQFEQVLAPGPEQMRYMNPGAGSANMEPAGWFFQYLRALPTLRLTGQGHTAEFPTAGWLAALQKEPLCAGSGA